MGPGTILLWLNLLFGDDDSSKVAVPYTTTPTQVASVGLPADAGQGMHCGGGGGRDRWCRGGFYTSSVCRATCGWGQGMQYGAVSVLGMWEHSTCCCRVARVGLPADGAGTCTQRSVSAWHVGAQHMLWYARGCLSVMGAIKKCGGACRQHAPLCPIHPATAVPTLHTASSDTCVSALAGCTVLYAVMALVIDQLAGGTRGAACRRDSQTAVRRLSPSPPLLHHHSYTTTNAARQQAPFHTRLQA